ncbi:leucine-rich repeat-containing protein 3 [Neopelma chrysocephalum]|uniref:leucine-rich repeat-containing protein 3 n=1 Tax=Neopelma chrysocephalum TaxID=114329 RepID=UPI000FCD4BBE|nr:leucine-rich repeat-containing protein 3 [Neopelma chrysocephalum]
MGEALQERRGAALLLRSCCRPRGVAGSHAELPGCKMTFTTTTPAASVAQAFFCLLLCIPWGSSCPPSCQCTERAGAKAVLCSSRHLEEIPKDIPRDAVFLKLDANSITRIPSNAFRHLSHLEELDLSRNAIEKIDRAAFKGVAAGLRTLDLSSNRIRSIPKEALLALNAKLRLANNPWHCECALQEVLWEARLDPDSVQDITCHTAPREEYVGKPLLQVLDAGVNFCSVRQRTTDVAMFITMFGWFAMVIVYVICYVRHNREGACKHVGYLKSLPSTQGHAETTSTAL